MSATPASHYAAAGRWFCRRARALLGGFALSAAVGLGACDSDAAASSAMHDDAAGAAGRRATSASGLPELCAREVASGDVVRDLFCADPPPEIRDLADLKQRLTNAALGRDLDILLAIPVLLGHSTSLSGQLVSSINPRAIFILSTGGGPILTFTRGVQQVEIAGLTHDRAFRRFYLLKFSQACNDSPEGCRAGDLYTPQIEQDWLGTELYDEEDLKNTASDCRQCHQRARSTPTLLMRELTAPWTHFFEPVSQEEGLSTLPGVVNSALARDYVAAKGSEPYAGIDVERLPPSAASLLQAVAGIDQPLLFPSQEILNQRWPRREDDQYPDEPRDSAIWENAYAAFKRGEQLALPYVEQRATDPDKLAERIAQYAAYRDGELDASELPDLSDVFPDDPRLRARIGLQTEPGASAVDTLIQGCGACHNDVLDQSLTRARFSIDVSRMDDTELDRAIERIERPRDEPSVMPPAEARQLDPEARDELVRYLRGSARSGEVEEALVRAAKLGMAGGSSFDLEATTEE